MSPKYAFKKSAGEGIRTPVKEAMSPINSVSPLLFPFFFYLKEQF
jgi:hypothetical protein